MRGDVVVSAAPGDYGKPRPAVVVQTDGLSRTLASMLLCPLSSFVNPELLYRPVILPDEGNGLRLPSQAMTEKFYAQPREKVGVPIGRLTRNDLARLDEALRLVLDLE